MKNYKTFRKSLRCYITYNNRVYEITVHREHIIKGDYSWNYRCDKYNRTGTSQCFDTLRFMITGDRIDGHYTTGSLNAIAITDKGNIYKCPIRVIEAI